MAGGRPWDRIFQRPVFPPQTKTWGGVKYKPWNVCPGMKQSPAKMCPISLSCCTLSAVRGLPWSGVSVYLSTSLVPGKKVLECSCLVLIYLFQHSLSFWLSSSYLTKRCAYYIVSEASLTSSHSYISVRETLHIVFLLFNSNWLNFSHLYSEVMLLYTWLFVLFYILLSCHPGFQFLLCTKTEQVILEWKVPSKLEKNLPMMSGTSRTRSLVEIVFQNCPFVPWLLTYSACLLLVQLKLMTKFLRMLSSRLNFL